MNEPLGLWHPQGSGMNLCSKSYMKSSFHVLFQPQVQWHSFLINNGNGFLFIRSSLLSSLKFDMLVIHPKHVDTMHSYLHLQRQGKYSCQLFLKAILWTFGRKNSVGFITIIQAHWTLFFEKPFYDSMILFLFFIFFGIIQMFSNTPN